MPHWSFGLFFALWQEMANSSGGEQIISLTASDDTERGEGERRQHENTDVQ